MSPFTENSEVEKLGINKAFRFVVFGIVLAAALTVALLIPCWAAPKNVMVITLDADTGELIGVFYNQDRVQGIPLDKHKPAQLKMVPLSPSNFSIVVYSHGSPGCYSYIHDGKRYCVPPGCCY